MTFIKLKGSYYGTNKMVSLNAVKLTDGYITSLNNSIPVKFIRMRVEEV